MAHSVAFALLAFLPQASLDDKAAEELLKAFREKVEKAGTLRVEYEVFTRQGEFSVGLLSAAVKLKGKDRWTLDLKANEDGEAGKYNISFTAQCDGRKVRLAGATKIKQDRLMPELVATSLRRAIEGSLLDHFSFMGEEAAGAFGLLPAPVVSDIRDGGKERVDGKEVRAVGYTAKYGSPDTEIGVRLHLDPVGMRPVRREFTFQGITFVETFTAFAFDEDLPDSDFSYQSNRRLARARVAQLAKSVELYGRFTGRHPRALEDLVRRPEALEKEVFWPEGGFVLGGALPKDPWGHAFELRVQPGAVSVASLGADGKPGGKGDDEDAVAHVPGETRRAVGAPTDRLAKHYTACVRLHLIAAAVRAYCESYGEMPRKDASLWDRPEAVEVWPEGGWLPGGKVPDDPWGSPYWISISAEIVRVRLQDPFLRTLYYKWLSPEERARLEETARPRLSPAERQELERLARALGDEDLSAREKAEIGLRAWGPAALPVIEERLQVEKDAETLSRLQAVRSAHPPTRPAWLAELKPITLTVAEGAVSEESDDACRNSLAQLWRLQAIYRTSRGHGKHVADTGTDFWLALAKTGPPLVPPPTLGLFVCPDSGLDTGEGVCTYAGPATDVNELADGDVVGMCDDEVHGDRVILLFKSGAVQVAPRGGDLHQQAIQKTKR